MPLGITNAFNAAISGYGYSVNPVIYIASALPVGVCFIILYSLSIRYLFRCDMSCLTNLNVDQLESMKNVSTKFNKFQIIYLLSFLVDIGYSFALLLIPKTVSWYGSFASITQAGWFLLVIVVLCIVKIDGKPLMNANKHFKEGSMWGMITAVGIFSMLTEITFYAITHIRVRSNSKGSGGIFIFIFIFDFGKDIFVFELYLIIVIFFETFNFIFSVNDHS